MKKILALVLTGLLVLSGFGVAIASAVSADNAAQPIAATNTVYLVPGTYVSGGKTVENTISSGAQKLSQAECDAIFTDNAYKCTLAVGAKLPTPTSQRTDSNGKSYTFNGWWSIVDATVTYFDTVPAASVTNFLYADWRADLSQRRDPVEPGEGSETNNVHYMEITRKATGETERIILRVSGTDRTNAETLGYGQAVQLYNEKFSLSPGDIIKVYTTGLVDSEQPQVTPISINDKRGITLESAGDGSNRTKDYLEENVPLSYRNPCYMTCIATATRNYRIYIKFFSGGSTMTVYMEPVA